MRERQRQIVEFVQKFGIASIADLAGRYGVSEFTIRRDIDYLSQSHLVIKVKGGAKRIDTPSQFREAALTLRRQINVEQKEKIARKALEFIEPGDTIFLDGSSTIITLAQLLAKTPPHITVVTNSILIALDLAQTSSINLVGLGGVFDEETYSYIPFDEKERPVESVHVNKAFLSCAGFICSEGMFENAVLNSMIKRKMVQNADEVYLLIDASKFGRRALAHVLDTESIDTLITDACVGNVQEELQCANVKLVVAD